MSSTAVSEDKRRFSRVPFQSKVLVSNEGGKWVCQLIDISLKGILITLPANWTVEPGDLLRVELVLDPNDAIIHMESTVAHIENDHVGLTCQHIDIDSISHLRRLVELNVGDPEILQRELSELINHG
ncbi:MAG: PilZ domain-containing protein [Gammaproteobacteria bacterium]|nr:PilZ domain-containing protein [Gammaproteobacteria bacterium]